jgi:hypothetical protein
VKCNYKQWIGIAGLASSLLVPAGCGGGGSNDAAESELRTGDDGTLGSDGGAGDRAGNAGAATQGVGARDAVPAAGAAGMQVATSLTDAEASRFLGQATFGATARKSTASRQSNWMPG